MSRATPAAISVTMVNRGSSDVEIKDPRGYACTAPFEVADASGQRVELPGVICAAPAYDFYLLKPGATVTIQGRWSADRSDGFPDSAPVAPGVYHVTARVYGARRMLTSPPLVLTVIAR